MWCICQSIKFRVLCELSESWQQRRKRNSLYQFLNDIKNTINNFERRKSTCGIWVFLDELKKSLTIPSDNFVSSQFHKIVVKKFLAIAILRPDDIKFKNSRPINIKWASDKNSKQRFVNWQMNKWKGWPKAIKIKRRSKGAIVKKKKIKQIVNKDQTNTLSRHTRFCTCV